MNVYTVGWILWGLYFVVLEGFALARKEPGDTLSEHVWKWFKSDQAGSPLKWPLRRYLLIALLLWLAGHLAFGWWASW